MIKTKRYLKTNKRDRSDKKGKQNKISNKKEYNYRHGFYIF